MNTTESARDWLIGYANTAHLFHDGTIDEPMFRAWLLGMGFKESDLDTQVESFRPRTPAGAVRMPEVWAT
jgi:hypothetical protein